MNFQNIKYGDKLVFTILGLLAILLLFISLYIGKLLFFGSSPERYSPTITVSAAGEVMAVPDIATFTFAVVQEGANVNEAQNKMAEKLNGAVEFVKSKGIEEKDIKTSYYSANPKYNYTQNRGQVLVGYEARQSVTVKVRDQSKAGDLISGVGSLGATEISNLIFESEDPDELKQQATEDAIRKAKEKAERLAKEGGFRLGKIVSFNEDMGGIPVPYYEGMRDAAVTSAPQKSATINPGENRITSSVSITYEIK
jgi:uncharacterized protein